MKITVFQPPYPTAGTPASASDCLHWMRDRLESLKPGEQELVLLPEYANAPGLEDRETVQLFAAGPGTAFVQASAATTRRLGCLVVVPALVQDGARWLNRTLVFDAQGATVARYDKLHITDAEQDDMGLAPGAAPAVVEHGGIRLGFATCFDLYFPEYFATLAARHVDIVLCPSYQRSESGERIRLIAQTRALDSGAYVVRSGYAMGSPATGGHALVAAPDGQILADAGTAPGIITVEINPRHKFIKPASHGRPPVEHRALIGAHRRPGVYPARAALADALTAAPFPRLCAHRGLSLACPENTLPAFAAAMAAGAHEIEFDVWMSRDGVPVICHDATVDRTTDGSGHVTALDWADIRRLDAGIKRGPEWAGVRMPRLEEVLDMADGRVGLNIHVLEKEWDGRLVRRVCDLLRQRALTEVAYIAGYSEEALRVARTYDPGIPLACLVSQDNPNRSLELARQYACQRIQFFRDITPDHIRRAHAAGLVCNLFWSDEPADAMNYVRMGIDVILTNCTHTMVAGGLPSFTGRQP